MAEQKKRTSDGLYSALMQISKEEGVDFGLSGMSADDFKNKYFTGPGNIENLYHRLNKISKEEGIDFGQGSRDEWLSSFGYKRNGDGQRGYQTLDGRAVGRRKSPAPAPQPQRKDSVNAEDGYVFTEGGLDSAFNQGFPVRAVDGQGKPLSSQPQPKPSNGVATTFGTPYKPDYQLTAAQRDEIHKRNDFAVRQMQQMEQRMREEEQRRNKPIVDTGSEAVNRHVIKTQGQWEDELSQGARRISSSVVVPAVDKAVKAFDKKADEIWGEYNEQSKFVDAASPFSVVTARRANEAKDPDKILDYLKKQMEGVYTDKSFVEEVAREADKMGIGRGEYIEKVVKPQIEADLGAHLGETLMKREMPKSTADYILGGLGNSIVGMLYNAMTETKGQRAYKNQAAAMTEEGHNPYYQPGTGARLTQMGVTFAADAPFFGLYGKVGGQVAKQVAEQQIKRLMAKGLSEGAARSVVGTALENSVGARMKNYLMQHVISGSITMGGFNMTSEAARQVRDSEFSPGRILGSGAEGAVTGAAFGLTGGAVQAVSQPLSGIARIGAATGGFLAEAETMYATEELSKMVHGEEGFTNPFEGSVEALMKLGVMKASSGHPLMKAVETGASIGRNGVRKTVANALAAKQSGMRFTEDEEAYVRNSTEGKNLLDALSQMHPETAIGEVNGKKKLTAEGEQLRQQLADRYNDFMVNTEIPYGVKMKVARALGGLMPDAAHTPLETGADIIHHADGSVTVKTRDKDGNCMQDFKFDTFSDAEAWRDAHEEQFRLNDAVNMWNGSPMEARTKMLSELMEEYGVDAQQARQMIDATLNGSMGTSFEGEQFLDIYDTIRRNAYPADEPHTRRNYWEGRKISPEERHQAMLEAQRAEERLEYMDMSFADELREAVDYPDEKIAELAGREDITGEQLQAAIDYFNKMSKVNGMMEEAANSVDRQVEAANDFIRRNTHTGSGQLIECEHGGNGYYVTAGNIKLNPDGSIDGAGSGDVIIVRDKITGEIEVVNPRNVMVTAISDPSRMIADNDSMDGLRGRLMKEADDSITLSPDTPTDPKNGDMFTASDGNRYVAMQMDDGQGNASWVKMALNENMEPEGEPQPFDIDEYRKAKSIELDELNMPREEQPLTEEEIPTDNVLGVPDGEMPVTEGPDVIDRRNDDSGTGKGDAPVPPATGTNQPPSRIPVDEKGRPQYEQATPEDTMAELTEKYGEEKAQRMVATLAENTARHLEELSQKDTSKMTDMADLAAHEDALAEAQRKAGYWGQFVRREEPKAEETVPTEPENVPVEPEQPVVPLKEEPQPTHTISETPMQPQVHEQHQPPVQPQQPTKQEKIYRGSVEANIGRTFTFTNNAGVRSELTIQRIDRDGNAVVARRDYDAEGNPIGEVREESYAATKVGEAIVGSTWKKVQSTEERLREAYKGRVGILNIIDVLTEPEMEQMLAAHDRGDNDALRELQNEFVERHREDIILKGRDKRNQKVGDILGGGFSIGEKLRRIRKQFQGYDDAELALSDEALQPSTLEEYVADLHNSIPKSGEGPLAYFSYERDGVKVVGMQDETGHGLKSGGDTKGYAPWLAPKGKGMSLAKYAENIHEQLPDGVKEQYSDQDVRNAIIEVFGGAERPSDIPTMIIRRGVIQAEQAARRMEEMWIDGVSYQKKPKSFADRLRRGIEMTSTEPTEAQKAAGNYAKGHVSFGGYDFTIENPAGSLRRGKDADGRQWEQQMHNTYGYILGRYGKDGDHLDMFINDQADLDNWNGRVYVVDQVNKDGSFDEHKVMYGFDSEEEARQAYLSNYENGWQGLGKITGVGKEKFDEWLDSSKRKMKPFAEHSIGREAAVEDVRERMRQEEQRQREAQMREQVLMNVTIEHMQQHGMDVIVGEEGQRVLDKFNGKLTDDLKQMGSRVDSKKKQLSNEIGQRELSENQQIVVDVFTGKSDNLSITVSREGKDHTVKMRQGNERGAGTKHSLFRHYGTGVGVITVDDIIRIPDVLADGERTEKRRGKTRLNVYQLTGEDGTKYTVLTEISNRGNEVFNDFYTNKKASSAARLTAENSTARRIDNVNGHTNTQLSAQADTNNASSGAKVQQNTETAKDSEENKPKFFKTPDGEAYGYTYKGKIYIDPKIANSETPIHEYGHLWTGMKRASAPEEWAEIKKVLLGDRLVKPIIDKVREEYPELTTEGREDDFVEELLTQFSGKRGAERLREVAEQVARENGGVFGKAEAVTAMQRLKNVLNRFWESVAKMLGVKYRNANDIADMMMRDFLNGVDPRKQMTESANRAVLNEQRETERTLMGVHNVSEEKLKKIIKQGGLANPSLAVIDTKQHMHTGYGEISLIPKSALIDARTGQNAGTWTADAWTPRYPQVQKRMSNKGEERYWKETREALDGEPGDIRSKTMMAFESWMENGISPERLSYWYLKERGKEPEQVMYEPSMAKDDIEAFHSAMSGHRHFSELDAESRKTVLALIAKEQGITPDELTAKVQEVRARNEQRMEDENVKPFVKMHAERVIGEIDEYGVPYNYISDFEYKVRNAEETDGKVNVGATLEKAAEQVKSESLESDFERWLEEKEKAYDIEEWLYNGTDNEGRSKWVKNTLDNASRLMKKDGRNAAYTGMGGVGPMIAAVAKRVTTREQIRKEKKNLATTVEEHDAFREKWSESMLELVKKCYDGDLWVGEARLQEALGEKNPIAYLKKEYGVELSKEDQELLNTFIKEVRENYPTGYFETKFERPVGLDEFAVAVVPEGTSADVVKALKDAGLDVHTYDGTEEGRQTVTMDAVKGRDDIMFQKVSHPEPELTPEERQYWTQWDKAMKKWKERNGLPADAQMPTERPKFQQGEQALDYAKRLMQHNRELALWQTAPKMEDYRQVRTDKDAARAARENEECYPASPSAKMRRVAAEALRLRHAMSRQKVYDKATVKAVTDFAQDFMRMGFGDNLSRGEMERMLSSVKNATGAKDIRKQVDNIMNILIDNQLRNLDQQVVKLSSVKELKQTAQGVEAQGKLELKGQRMIQAFREARQERMTADKIRERMAEVSEKMTRNDDEAPMWEQEYEGLTIALQYVENIEGSREEWADLDREYKDAVKEYKQSGRSYQAQQELLESLEQAMMENKVERIGMFGDIIGRLEGNISESIQGAKEFVEREKQRIKHIQQIANFDLAGKDMSAMRTDDRGKAVGKGKAANFFLQPLGTFEQMLRQFGSRNANGEGYLYDHFMRTWMDATDKAYVNEVKVKEELDAKARELFGKGVKRWSDLYELSTKEAADVEVVDQGETKTLKLTQGNLLYIYMADKMADGRMKLRKMGIDEEHIEQIKEAIDPRLLQLGDWLQDEYLVKKRTEYNKVHERMFGAPMAAIDHYFPIKILGDARIQEQDVANMADQDAVLPSTITGSIIKRRRNALPLDILHTDALSLALEHIEDMERWAAQAEWNKDVNTLLSYTTFRNKVKNMKTIYGSGDALWNTFADTARMAAGTYRPKVKPGSVDTAISNIAKGVTAAKINFRVYTAFKQTLSAPAFLHDVNLGDFVKYSVNPYGSWKWAMENMPVFRKRWESRQVGDTRLMDDPTDWKMWKTDLVKKATMLGMSPNAIVDGITCAVGARAIYESRYRKYKKIGATDETARKRALQDAEIGYNLTQQSSEGAFVSAIQKDRTVAANMLSVFRNSSMAYTRQWVDASRNLRHRMQKGYRDDSIQFMARQMQEQFGLDEAQAKKAAEAEYARAGRRDVARLLNMMFGVTVAWNLGASLPYLLIGDDDHTKKEMLTDAMLKAMVAGPTEGFASGNLMSDIAGRMLSEQTRNTIESEGWGAGLDAALKQGGDYEINPLPLMADIQGMIKKMGYDKYAAAQDVFNICMQSAVGVNPQTFTDMWNACMDYGAPGWDGTSYTWEKDNMARPKEIALFLMRMMNAPVSSWRNKYIDELGMNAEDAKKLSYDEMAKRYAHYKHWKDAPLTGWLRGEETRQEKIDKIRKQFDKAVDERIARLTNEELRDNLGRSTSIEERRRYARLIHSRIGGDGKDAQNAKEEWQQNYQHLMQYDDISEDELLSVKKKEARTRGDNKTVKAIQKLQDRIRDKGKKKLGTGNDADLMNKIRQWRREAIELAIRAEGEE